MFFPTLTPSGTTEHSPIVTSPELYILGSLTLGTSSPTPSSTLSPITTSSAIIDLLTIVFLPITEFIHNKLNL